MLKRSRVVLFFLWIANSSQIFAGTPVKEGTPVDIVFCIDLSGSTNGIITRLRNHLWDYIHELNSCNPKPDLRIGFIGYGRPSFGKENNYVKVIENLTYDMDGLSFDMFQLIPQIDKGEAPVEAALMNCLKKISWSTDPAALKVIFLGGNGMVNLSTEGEKYIDELTKKGVIVNSVYMLNNPIPGEVKGWENIAALGNGKFANMQIKFEYYENTSGFNLKELWKLNEDLNSTYLYYGAIGKERLKIQKANDSTIFKANSEGYRYRMQFRISDLYLNRNSNWDLVDLHSKDPDAAIMTDRQTVSDSMKYMSSSDFKSYIAFCKYKRKRTVIQIRKMLDERETSLKEINGNGVKGMKTFDVITIGWLKDLMKAKGYDCGGN